MKSRIMYIEHEGGNLTGAARIGRVTFSKTMKRVYYRDQVFQRNEIPGYKANHYDIETGDEYRISGPTKAGGDRLYGERVPVLIDPDVRLEFAPDRRLDQAVAVVAEQWSVPGIHGDITGGAYGNGHDPG